MPIHAYVGLPRSGKSYTAVEQVILPALRKGRIVVTNIPMRRDAVVRDIPQAEQLLREFPLAAVQAQPDTIFDHCPNGSVVVLDEVWRFWPAGKKVDQIPEAFKSFLAEHGHRVDVNGDAMVIVLVTQNIGQIAAFARQQIEQTFKTTKLTSVGFNKRFRTDVYVGAVSDTAPQSQRLREIFGTYSPKIYQYYTSHTMSEAAEGGANEKAIDDRGNVLRKPIVIATPLLIIGLIYFGVTHLRHPLHPAGTEAAPGSHEGGAVVTPGGQFFAGIAPGASVQSTGEARPKVRTWWVSGVVSGSLGVFSDVAFITDGEVSAVVELSACRRSKFDWWCPTESGQFVSSRHVVKPAAAAPLAKQSGAPGERLPGTTPPAGG